MKSFTVLIEEDFAQKNYAGYVPELRISAVGDSEQDVIESLQDLIQIEMEKNEKMPVYRFGFKTQEFKFSKNGGLHNGLKTAR
ncbi:hypothetical protein QYF50_26115 [Paenibacillus vini]|uniref:hypothetical protein n=1 Tax=Paenibacillus vini TaxID=1476024 RepID=UPI0025B67AE4|nr:hypothetical protein [Paenibacillus vini]MDN4071372.1 hypothetical protein [Paenibacillus vini]